MVDNVMCVQYIEAAGVITTARMLLGKLFCLSGSLVSLYCGSDDLGGISGSGILLFHDKQDSLP